MLDIRRCVEVGIPVRTAYVQWIELEGLPLFFADLRGVREVRYTRLCWSGAGGTADPGDVEVSVALSDGRIRWRGVTAGRVTTTVDFCRRLAGTRVSMRVRARDRRFQEWGPGELGTILAYADTEMRESLERLRRVAREQQSRRSMQRGARRRNLRLVHAALAEECTRQVEGPHAAAATDSGAEPAAKTRDRAEPAR
jgi:uncharacterized membrane protein